jgi:DNA-binding NarL/FixJ family response regulator
MSSPPRRLTVLVADDHVMVASSLTETLSQWFATDPPVNTLEQLRGALTSWTTRNPLDPLVVVLDLDFRGVSALRALPDLTRDFPEVTFLMLSGHFTESLVDHALQCGAMGYLAKGVGSTELRWAIEAVAKGRFAVYGDEPYDRKPSEHCFSPKARLTPALRRAVQLFSKGKSRREISVLLGISESGVDALVARVRALYGLPPREPIEWQRLVLRYSGRPPRH